jgi:hypothetical protein
LAFLLKARGQLGEAETLLNEAFDGSRRALGDDHADTRRYIQQLVILRGAMAAARGAGRRA